MQDNLPKKHSKLNIKRHNNKSHLWIFVNCPAQNPTPDSQTKENMTLKSSRFIIQQINLKESTKTRYSRSRYQVRPTRPITEQEPESLDRTYD
jgi:DNA gyrase/topoisomerase IV subunit B